MTTVVIVGAIVLFASFAIGVVVWAVKRGDVRGDTRADQLAKERFDHAATRTELERAKWERGQALKEVEAGNRAIRSLWKLKRGTNANPNADLHDDDDLTRLVRIAAEEARAAEAARDGALPAGELGDGVHRGASTEAKASPELLAPDEV